MAHQDKSKDKPKKGAVKRKEEELTLEQLDQVAGAGPTSGDYYSGSSASALQP